MTKTTDTKYYNTTDQMGREVRVPFAPKRIISLVPSQTELLYYLGLDKEVIAQTIFCIHPSEQHQLKPRIGGTKKLNLAKIASMKPDLIIGNKEENDERQIKELMELYPVWMSDIKNLDNAFDMIKSLGKLVGKEQEAIVLKTKLELGFNALPPAKAATCLYFIWRDPWMVAGNETFINDLLGKIGFSNAAQSFSERYPILTADNINELHPDFILLSSEPFPFKQKHIEEIQAFSRNSNIQLVDGEFFSWYGSRLIHTIKYFESFFKINSVEDDFKLTNISLKNHLLIL